MSPLDKELIQSKLARIRRNLVELRKLAKLPFKEYIRSISNTAVADHKRVHRFLQKDLGDFETFVEVVARYIAK